MSPDDYAFFEAMKKRYLDNFRRLQEMAADTDFRGLPTIAQDLAINCSIKQEPPTSTLSSKPDMIPDFILKRRKEKYLNQR